MTPSIQTAALCILLTALVTTTGCDRLIDQIRQRTEEAPEEEREGDSDDIPIINVEPTSERPRPARTLRDGQVDYFKDHDAITGPIEKKFGHTERKREVHIYPTRVRLQVQDQDKPKHADKFILSAANIDKSGPVRLHMLRGKSAEEHLAAATFGMSDVDMSLLSLIVKEAPSRLNSVEEGKVKHVMLKRNVPFSNAVQWRVYITGERGGGSVVYDTKGNMTRVFD